MANTSIYSPVRQIVTPVAPGPPPVQDYEDVLTEMVGYAAFYGVNGGEGRPLRTVTSSNNSGAGTLRQVLADNPNGSWIIFPEGVTWTIQLTSTLNWVSNTTIDGRGADITIKGPLSGSSNVMNARSGNKNFILMYVKTPGSNTPVPSGDNDDGLSQENGTGGYSPTGNNVEKWWYYHVSMSDSEDEVCTCIRCEGKATIQSCSLINNNQASASTSHEQGFLISHGSNGNNYGWEQVEVKLSFFRNYWFCGDRMPFITVPSRIHSVNNYRKATTGSGHFLAQGKIHVTSRYNAPANSANLLSENETFDGPFQFIKPTLGTAIDGNARIVGSRLLNGATNATRNTSLVTDPPYSYSMVTASAANDAIIIAESGWQNVVNPAH